MPVRPRTHLSPIVALAAAVALALSASPAVAEKKPKQGATADAPARSGSAIDAADRRFVQKAAAGGVAEVELGKLAQQRASDDRVRQFGERMVQDHGKANDELKAIAASKDIEVPTAPEKTAQKDAGRLAKLEGPAFDAAYMRHMVEDHKNDVAAFEKASRSAKDPEIKAFAGKALPTLKEHLTVARSTYEAVRKADRKLAAR